MKKFCVMMVGLLAIGLAMPSMSLAAKGEGKKGGKKADVFTQYDANSNGTLDKEEKDAILKDFEKKPDGRLKRFDADNDGKLSEKELDAIKPGAKGKKKEK